MMGMRRIPKRVLPAVAGWVVAWACWLTLGPVAIHAQHDEYEAWLEAQQQEYQQFLSEQDRAFVKYLRQAWQRVDVDPAAHADLGPKPATVPTATPTAERTPATTPDESPPAQRESSPPAPPRETPEAAREQPNEATEPPAENPSEAALGRTAALSFFGARLNVPYAPALTPALEGAPDRVSISTFWIALSRAEHAPFVEALQRQRRTLALGDWGYYLLVRDVARRLYGGPSHEARLLTWFVMIKSGYAARVGYTDDGQLFLLLPSEDQAFKLPQLRLDGQRYYIVNEDVPRERGALHTYDGDYPEADQTVDFALARAPRLPGDTARRTVAFDFRGTRHELALAYDAGYVDYLERYPMMELPVYFTAALSPIARERLRADLQPLLEGKSQVEAVNLLLRFVQRAFPYKRDDDHFGEERYLFPEETLASPYSDCEDRAALFATLVRELLDLDVIGLRYPGHVAAAVRLDTDVNGGTVAHDGATYVVADPTYFGADAGMVMPFVQEHAPDVIALSM